MPDLRMALALAALTLGCSRTALLGLDATGSGGSGAASTASGGAGGGASFPLCADDGCTLEGCPPVLVLPFDAYLTNALVAEAPRACVAFEASDQGDGATAYRCFDRCGERILTATGEGFESAILLEGGKLTAATGLFSAGSFSRVTRRDLGAPDPEAATLVWASDIAVPFDSLGRWGDGLYFSWPYPDKGIYRMPYAGGEPERVSDWMVSLGDHAMRIAGGTAYFHCDQPAHAGVAALDLGGGQPPALLHAAQGEAALALDVAAGRVVWADTAGGDLWAVRSIGIDGTDPKLLGQLMVRVTDIAADAEAIYLVTSHNGEENLLRLPLGGGAPLPLVEGETRISWLVQDADYLYYVGHDGVYRLRKPG